MRHEPHQACRLACHALGANIHAPSGEMPFVVDTLDYGFCFYAPQDYAQKSQVTGQIAVDKSSLKESNLSRRRCYE